jgi:hypothetical protein
VGADTLVTSTTPATNTKVYRETTGSADVQYIRRHTASVMTADAWAMTTVGVASRAAADEARTSLTFTNCGTAIAFMRPDSTIPSASAYYVQLNPGETYEVEDGLTELAWSVSANANSAGNLLIWKGTAP